jgi:hypothetical protein
VLEQSLKSEQQPIGLMHFDCVDLDPQAEKPHLWRRLHPLAKYGYPACWRRLERLRICAPHFRFADRLRHDPVFQILADQPGVSSAG